MGSTGSLPFSYAAPEKPSPPNVTVGEGMFSIDDLGPQDEVVEYVCQYTSVITSVTLQVKMKPSEAADVPLERSGGYLVQVRASTVTTRGQCTEFGYCVQCWQSACFVHLHMC